MKRRTKYIILTIPVLALLGMVAALMCIWGYKYFGLTLPEFSDNRYYENLEKRAEASLTVARRHHLNEQYCLLVDYSIPCGTPRLFVWSYKENQVVATTYVMHGPGKGSTAENPVFSNQPGSNCSTLGHFAVTRSHGQKLKRSFRLKGIDFANRTAWTRGLMIHSSAWVDANCWRDYIPLHEPSCKGCVTVSNRGMRYLENLIRSQEKPLLLWSFASNCNTNK